MATEKTPHQNEIESLKKGFDLLDDHVIITDADGNIVYANKAVEKNTGFSTSEVLGKKPGEIWGGRMPPEFYKRMWHTIKEQKQPFVGEVKNVTKQGKEYWQELHISPVLGKNGDIKFFIGVEPNITDRKQKEQFRNSFLLNTGTQIQRPLQAIGWMISWITTNSSLSDEDKEVLRRIQDEHHTLADLFDRLLETT